MLCKLTVDLRDIDAASGLPLKIFVSANVIGVRMRIVNGSQTPAMGFQNLTHFTPGVLIVSAVYQTHVGII